MNCLLYWTRSPYSDTCRFCGRCIQEYYVSIHEGSIAPIACSKCLDEKLWDTVNMYVEIVNDITTLYQIYDKRVARRHGNYL